MVSGNVKHLLKKILNDNNLILDQIIKSNKDVIILLVLDKESQTLGNRNPPKYILKLELLPGQNTNQQKIQNLLDTLPRKTSSQHILQPFNTIQYTVDNSVPLIGHLYQYMPKGNIVEFLFKKSQPLDEQVIKSIFYQMCLGIEFLHQNRIAHQDIKLNNFVIGDFNQVMVIDLGLSTQYPQENIIINGFVGTDGYQSPQMINFGAFNPFKNDIFSLGVCLYALKFKALPWNQASLRNPSYLAFYNSKDSIWKDKSVYADSEFQQLVNSMLQYDENLRPTISQIKSNKWLNN